MDGMRAPQRLRRRLRDPEMANLARHDELRHRADRLLDRHPAVDAVLVVEVDVVETQPPQRGVAGLPHVLGVAADLARAVSFRTLPNFVASTTSSRRSRIAFPTSSSFAPLPYMSAVSRKSMPRSSARWIVAIASPSSVVP
jgi:hypothetical protein